MDFMTSFIKDNTVSSGVFPENAALIQKLVEKYKLPNLQRDCSTITADFGSLGSVVVRNVVCFEKQDDLKYERGNYDYISVGYDKCNYILWTDYENIEPYNRQSGLYCDGMSFRYLGNPVVEKPSYREFNVVLPHHVHQSEVGVLYPNSSFALWGFTYNNFWNSVRFGLAIKTEDVEVFIVELRKILNK